MGTSNQLLRFQELLRSGTHGPDLPMSLLIPPVLEASGVFPSLFPPLFLALRCL